MVAANNTFSGSGIGAATLDVGAATSVAVSMTGNGRAEVFIERQMGDGGWARSIDKSHPSRVSKRQERPVTATLALGASGQLLRLRCHHYGGGPVTVGLVA